MAWYQLLPKFSNHRQILHIQIDRHRDQIRIELAFLDLLGFDLFGLREVFPLTMTRL